MSKSNSKKEKWVRDIGHRFTNDSCGGPVLKCGISF